MKPGRELDALVAEKVMGWKALVKPHPEMSAVTLKDLYGDPNIPMPKYSTDIAAAWEVVEKISSGRARLFLNALWRDPNDGKWVFGSFDQDGDIWPRDKGDTAPHAICLAALVANGALEWCRARECLVPIPQSTPADEPQS